MINDWNGKDDKKGVDRSSTVIAKDPEGKKKQNSQTFYFINNFKSNKTKHKI